MSLTETAPLLTMLEMADHEGLPMGIVDFGGARREVCLAYVAEEAGIGDWVIVHAGFAISRLETEEAERTLQLLREMGEGWDVEGKDRL